MTTKNISQLWLYCSYSKNCTNNFHYQIKLVNGPRLIHMSALLALLCYTQSNLKFSLPSPACFPFGAKIIFFFIRNIVQ